MLRYAPGAGWTREFLLSSTGAVSKPLLRGVAWPEPGRAHAVGDLGAMWMWRAETGLWERDPAAPVGFEGNLMGVAFAARRPAARLRGRQGGRAAALRQDVDAGAAARGLRRPRTSRSVAFAGSQAIVAAGADLLVNDGGGWRVDEDARALFARCRRRAALRRRRRAARTAARSPPGRTS